MHTTEPSTLDPPAGPRLSQWSLAIGAVAFATMFFKPLSLLGAAALIPGIKAIRADTPRRGRAILGMVLGVLATFLVASYLVSGSD